MYRKVKLAAAPSPTFNGVLEDQTAEHVLQRCPFLCETAKQNVWPTAVQLQIIQSKLYGGKEELERTVTFIYIL